MKEFRIFGPPGTGKTSALATKYVPGSIQKYGREGVMVTSFTRAAAREIASKRSRETGETINIPFSQVGTLHHICYHAMNQPVIVETDKDLIAEWNTAYPESALSPKSLRGNMDELYKDTDSEEEQNFRGERYLSTTNTLRNRMVDEENWSKEQRTFIKRWREFKKDHMTMDFTDLIETALKDMPYAPGNPNVLYIDEAQDFTPLQLSLCRSWGQQMAHIVLVGDDDQSLYRFTGASPDAFLNPPISAKRKEVLTQSWRVPRAVLDCATKLIKRLHYREPKIYHPRFDPKTKKVVDGRVLQSGANWKLPEPLMAPILKDIAEKKTVMVLGSCDYMLRPLKTVLRGNGVPFGNRYRKSRTDWNPLDNKSTSIIAAFMSQSIDPPYWNVPQFLTWVDHILVDDQAGLKKKVGRKAILLLKDAVKNEDEGLHTVRHIIGQMMGPDAVTRCLNRDIEWLKEHMKAPYKNSLEYPLKVLAEHGVSALEDTPPVTIGTIHSVKGAEADSVYLFPDISMLANKEFYLSNDGFDSVIRVFYVGMTRAFEKLTLCKPGLRAAFSKRSEYLYVNLTPTKPKEKE